MLDTGFFTGPVFVTFIISVFSTLFLYWYSIRNFNYWTKRGVRQAKTIPFLGSVHETIKEPFHEIEVKRYNELGTIYGHYEMSKPLLTVADPDLIRDILVKDFHIFTNRRIMQTNNKLTDNMMSFLQNEDWKRIRTIVSPTFSTGKIKRVIGIFKDCSATAIKNFQKYSESSEAVDVKRIFGAYSMDVIASSAFSTKLDSHNDPDNEFIKHAKLLFSQKFSWRITFNVLFPKISHYLGISVFQSTIFNFFNDVTLQIIKERQRTEKVSNDFLQLLLNASNETNKEQSTDDCKQDVAFDNDVDQQINKSTKNLSLDELVAQCISFFLAGYETTASTIGFVMYLLALNVNCQEKVRAEVDEAIQKTGGEITYESIQSMKYLDNVISETMRLYPAAIRLDRTAGTTYQLANSGIILEKGTIVTIPVYALHRDPQHFPDPERFDPDRFNSEEKAKRSSYVYLPFGAGPRNCVGMRFALMEIKVAVADVIRHFTIKKSSQTKVPLEFYKGRPLLQPKSIMLSLAKC